MKVKREVKLDGTETNMIRWVWVYLERKEEIRELLGSKLVSLMIRKGGLKWSGPVEQRGDAD